MLVNVIYKINNSFSLPNMNQIFEIRSEHPFNLRQKVSVYSAFSKFSLSRNRKSILVRTKSLEYTAKMNSLLKKWKPQGCPCRICKKQIADVGVM